MESAVPQSGRMRDPASTVLLGRPNPLLGRMLAVFVCAASLAVWIWFSSPKPNYFFNPAVPLLFLFFGAVAVPMLVFFVGGVARLFMLKVPGLTSPVRTHRHARARHSRHYTFAVFFTAAAMISIMVYLPIHSRFMLSRPAMNALVADVQENPAEARPASMRVGLYVLETAPQLRTDGALMFYLSGDREAGFTYSAAPIGYPETTAVTAAASAAAGTGSATIEARGNRGSASSRGSAATWMCSSGSLAVTGLPVTASLPTR